MAFRLTLAREETKRRVVGESGAARCRRGFLEDSREIMERRPEASATRKEEFCRA
jgi:hypothetical protein